MPTRFGTAYFVTLAAAERYYRDYGDTRADVARRIAEGGIHIGKPPLRPGDRLTLIDNGRRYAIERPDAPPAPGPAADVFRYDLAAHDDPRVILITDHIGPRSDTPRLSYVVLPSSCAAAINAFNTHQRRKVTP